VDPVAVAEPADVLHVHGIFVCVHLGVHRTRTPPRVRGADVTGCQTRTQHRHKHRPTTTHRYGFCSGRWVLLGARRVHKAVPGGRTGASGRCTLQGCTHLHSSYKSTKSSHTPRTKLSVLWRRAPMPCMRPSPGEATGLAGALSSGDPRCAGRTHARSQRRQFCGTNLPCCAVRLRRRALLISTYCCLFRRAQRPNERRGFDWGNRKAPFWSPLGVYKKGRGGGRMPCLAKRAGLDSQFSLSFLALGLLVWEGCSHSTGRSNHTLKKGRRCGCVRAAGRRAASTRVLQGRRPYSHLPGP
jgi:hypothetical protein